jgi:hypothetical protein
MRAQAAAMVDPVDESRAVENLTLQLCISAATANGFIGRRRVLLGWRQSVGMVCCPVGPGRACTPHMTMGRQALFCGGMPLPTSNP